MITAWIDVFLAALLLFSGLYHLQLGEGRRQRAGQRGFGDLAALLTALLGGTLVAMGLVLVLYSAAYAHILSE